MAVTRILVAGPGHLRTVPAFAQTVATLRELGYAVAVFDLGAKRPLDRLVRRPLRRVLGRDEAFWPSLRSREWMNARLLRAAAAFRPDLFISIIGFDLLEGTLRKLRAAGTRTVIWWLNDPFHSDQNCRWARWYDLDFTNAPACVPTYRAVGFTNVHGLLHACYPPWHRPVTLTDDERAKYGCQIVFAGDWERNREEVLTRLAAKYRVKIWGPWRRKLRADSPLRACLMANRFRPDELATILAGGEIVLNLHTWFGKDDRGTNPRVFEASGCGAFQLCDWKEEIPGAFRDGEEIVLYRTLPELDALVEKYLPLAGERQRIARNAAARAHRDHTYRQRMRAILDAVAGIRSENDQGV